MGYNMHQVSSNFTIKAGNRTKAWNAVNILAYLPKHIAWVNKWSLRNAGILPRATAEFGWHCQEDMESGDIVGIQFTSEKAGDEDLLFSVLAPYVESGSYIEMLGEDGEMWKWVFTGGTVKRQTAKVVWE